MKLNRIELKKVIYDFNHIASRLIRASYLDYNSILAKFLAYIDGTKVIADFIKDCGEPTYEVKDEVCEVANSHGRLIFELGDTDSEEVANIYHILKYCSSNNIDIPGTIAFSYSSSNSYQDMTKEFNARVVMVFIRHIEGYLTKIGIDMGMDEHTRYSITVHKGQVNLASDSAVINASQINGIDATQLQLLLENVRRQLPPDLSQEDSEAALDNLEVIESEIAQSAPRKGFLKTALSGLQAIKGTAEFGAAVAALVQFVQNLP